MPKRLVSYLMAGGLVAALGFLAWPFVTSSILFNRGATESVIIGDDAARVGGRQLEIVSLLPKDAIPAIDDPRFVDAATADAQLAPDELVLGISINGDHRAYSTAMLSRHEIVNDVVGGVPVAVTW